MIQVNNSSLVVNIFSVLILLLFAFTAGIAQEYKREVEKGIKKNELPGSALETLQPFLDDARKIKFYFEEDMNKTSFECKFRLNKKWFSIEFTESGQLEDVEFLISLKDIPEKSRENIIEYLDRKYQRYKVTRLQKQFSADPGKWKAEEIIRSALENDEEGMTINFEMELNGNYDGQLISHELLFDHKGEFIREREIVRRQVDNILY